MYSLYRYSGGIDKKKARHQNAQKRIKQRFLVRLKTTSCARQIEQQIHTGRKVRETRRNRIRARKYAKKTGQRIKNQARLNKIFLIGHRVIIYFSLLRRFPCVQCIGLWRIVESRSSLQLPIRKT